MGVFASVLQLAGLATVCVGAFLLAGVPGLATATGGVVVFLGLAMERD